MTLSLFRQTLLGALFHSSSADVAQLVEHFTRNEGVGSSSLPVGF